MVAFDSNSGNANMTVNVASACASLIMSGTYAGTFRADSTLTTTSTITFVAACTLAGTAGTLILTGNTYTITSAGKTVPFGLTITANATITLGDNWAVSGLLTLNGTMTVNANQITASGGFTHGATSIAGSTKLVLTGGTWSATGVAQLRLPIDLAGNVTVSGTVGYQTGPLTYVSGTITTTGSTLTLINSTTLDVGSVTWENVTISSTAGTQTLTSNLVWTGTLTISVTTTLAGAGKPNGTGAVSLVTLTTLTTNCTGGLVTTGTMTLPNTAFTFAGTAGWTVGTLTTAALTASRIYTLTFGNTYRVTAAILSGATPVNRQALKSSSAGSQVTFTLAQAVVQQLAYCDPTDIDSSAGATVVSIGATISNSLNWLNSVSGGAGVAVGRILSSGIIEGLGAV